MFRHISIENNLNVRHEQRTPDKTDEMWNRAKGESARVL